MSYKSLFQKVYDLERWIYTALCKFPKNQKLLVQRIETTSTRILEMAIDLSEKDSSSHRKKILNEIHKLQILLRLCKDLSFLKFRQYEYASSLLAEISGLLDSQNSELKTQDSGQLTKNLGGGSLEKWF